MSSWWGERRGGHGRLDEHVERINEIANGLAAVSLAMQAEEPETARATADETLWQASQLLSEAVAQAEARARRRRTVTRVTTATAAVAAAAAIAISLPDAGPSFDPDRFAGDEAPSEVRHLEAWGHPVPGSLRDRAAVSSPEAAAIPARLHLEREALPPAPPVRAEVPDEDGTTITAAAPPDAVGDAPTAAEPEDPDGVAADDDETETAETHPGVLASGRAGPAGHSPAGAAAGPPGHATVTTGAGTSAGGTAIDA